ncbi:hypothetical protein JCM3765_003052 [Sporobolomyces pararoseus]
MDPQSAAAAAASFDKLGFFLLTDLPKGSEFGLDGQFWNVNQFNGVKLIPEGLHLFVVSSTSSNNQQQEEEEGAGGGGLGIRHGLLKFYHTLTSPSQDQEVEGTIRGEIVVEKWDRLNESLSSSYETISDERRRRKSQNKRKRTTTTTITRTNEEEEEQPAEIIVSKEYLKSLDSTLAPYPSSLDSEPSIKWRSLIRYVTEETIARVIGLDERGIARVDALLEGWREKDELVQARNKQREEDGGTDEGDTLEGEEVQGRTFWGRKRPKEEAHFRQTSDENGEEEEEEELEEEEEEGLRFLKFDEKRSWPVGSVGQELTRWSTDKSWLLSNLVQTRLARDSKELLGEFQLSFILFTLVYNFSSLSTYKSLFSLICRSSILTQPSSTRRPIDTPQGETLLPSETTLPLFASFLSVLESQLSFLDSNFFSTQLPSLESHLLSNLSHLRRSLSDSSTDWYSLPQDSPASSIWNTLVNRWNQLTAITMEKFGWELGLIEGSKARYGELERMKEKAGGGGEVPFEDLEEGEDAPVIVDLEEGDEDSPILIGF